MKNKILVIGGGRNAGVSTMIEVLHQAIREKHGDIEIFTAEDLGNIPEGFNDTRKREPYKITPPPVVEPLMITDSGYTPSIQKNKPKKVVWRKGKKKLI